LRREKLPIGESGGQLLVIHHAEPGSPSARALSRLAAAQPGEAPSASLSGPADGRAASADQGR
jgi:hypothetical protein